MAWARDNEYKPEQGETQVEDIKMPTAGNARLKVTLLTTSAMLAFATGSRADVVISSAPTSNMACSAGFCEPTAPSAVLNAAQLDTMLVSSPVTISTQGAGGIEATAIKVAAPVKWSANVLSLDATAAIQILHEMKASHTAALSLRTKDDMAGGVLTFSKGGKVVFGDPTAGQLVINDTPYTLVTSVQALAAAVAANPSGDYALARGYDASADGTYAASPVPTVFTGIFEGAGNTISDLSVSFSGKGKQALYVGLFGELEAGGAINDLTLSKVSVSTTGSQRIYAGGIVGFADAGTSLANLHVTGTLTGDVAGGVAGLVYGSISNATAAGSVDGTEAAGGLIGGAGEVSPTPTSATIVGCSASGTVTSPVAGGLIGSVGPAQISQSFATGTVQTEGSSFAAGGLAGSASSVAVDNSYFSGSVTSMAVDAGGSVGGLIGSLGGGNVSIADSYANAKVFHGVRDKGGDVGYVNTGGHPYVFDDLYWNTDLFAGPGVGNGTVAPTGLTTAQLQSGLPAGFDPSIWAQNASMNGGLPYLLAVPPK